MGQSLGNEELSNAFLAGLDQEVIENFQITMQTFRDLMGWNSKNLEEFLIKLKNQKPYSSPEHIRNLITSFDVGFTNIQRVQQIIAEKDQDLNKKRFELKCIVLTGRFVIFFNEAKKHDFFFDYELIKSESKRMNSCEANNWKNRSHFRFFGDVLREGTKKKQEIVYLENYIRLVNMLSKICADLNDMIESGFPIFFLQYNLLDSHYTQEDVNNNVAYSCAHLLENKIPWLVALHKDSAKLKEEWRKVYLSFLEPSEIEEKEEKKGEKEKPTKKNRADKKKSAEKVSLTISKKTSLLNLFEGKEIAEIIS